mmetsp:Transcript_122874/g.238990  ORF Transcript_122874/g.238990 Transcript_122874/m.238990 type:complete len:206 (-) Transcript_122874:1029-1646(-)
MILKISVAVIHQQRIRPGNNLFTLMFIDLLLITRLDDCSDLKFVMCRLLFFLTDEDLQCAPCTFERFCSFVHKHDGALACVAHNGPCKGCLHEVFFIKVLKMVLVVGKRAHPIICILWEMVCLRMELQHGEAFHERASPPMADEPIRVLWTVGNQLHKRTPSFGCQRHHKEIVDVVQVDITQGDHFCIAVWMRIPNHHGIQDLLY